MSDVRPIYDDEIDLFEFFETLWDSKWLISTFVVLATFLGFGYLQVAQPKYNISVPYTTNLYSNRVIQTCHNKYLCMETEAIKRFVPLSGNSWSKERKKSVLSFSTLSPLEQSDYEAQIKQASTALTNELFVDATTELAFIKNDLTDALLGTESIAQTVLNAKRVIQSIDNGESAIIFGSVSVVKSSPKVPLILVLSIVLGGMVGVCFILLRNAITKRKEQLAKS